MSTEMKPTTLALFLLSAVLEGDARRAFGTHVPQANMFVFWCAKENSEH